MENKPDSPYYNRQISKEVNESVVPHQDLVQYMQQHNGREGRTLESIKAIADGYKDKLGIDYSILSMDEAGELLKNTPQKYQGEPAFYYKGKVYFVQGQMTEENVIHEFSHPFIAAIAKENPVLFNNIFNKGLQEDGGNELWVKVQNAYSDTSEDTQKQEFVVRQFTALTQNKNKGKGFLSQLLFAIRQLFRKVFGKDINISKIDGNTTLSNLVNILHQSHKIALNTESISEKEEVDFARDIEKLVEDLNLLKNGDLVQIAEGFFTTTKTQLNKKTKGHQDIKENVVTKGQVNRLSEAASHLKNALNDENKKQVIDFALSLNAIKDWSTMMFERIGEIQSDTKISNADRTSLLSGFVDSLESWERYLTNLNKFIEDEKIQVGPEFRSIINGIMGQVQAGQTKILASDKETLIDVFTEVLSGVTKDAQEQFKKAEERYKANPTAKGAESAYKKAQDKLKNSTFDRKEILKYLRGEAGDSSKISGLFNSAASNGDPIVGGFGTLVRQIGYKVYGTARNMAIDMDKELAPLMHLWDKNNPAKSAQRFVVKDERVSYDAEGNLKESEVYTFLNKYKGYKKAMVLADHKIEEARKTEDPLQIKAAKEEKEELLSKYFHRQYTDEYYEAQKLKKDSLGKLAFAKRDELYEEMNRENSLFDKDAATEDEIQEHLDIIKGYYKQIARLSTLYDENGNLKSDQQDYEIAQRLREYAKKTRKFYEYEEKKGLFESRYNKHKNYLLSLGVDENSEDFKAEMQKWIDNNTRTVIKDEFYQRKRELTKRLSELLNKLPDAQRKKLAFDDQWIKILDIMKGIKDRDNQPVGSNLNESQVAAIKEAEELLEQIKDNFAKANGLSRAEDEELSTLMSIKRKKTQQESDRIKFLLNKKETEGLDTFSKNQMQLIIKELSQLQSKIPTDYYKDILDQKFSEMDIEPLTNNEDYEKLLSNTAQLNEMFIKSPRFKDWFLKNHIETKYWDPTTMGMQQGFKRLYIWDRVIPSDPNMFESTTLSDGTVIAGKPNFEYHRRKVKEEYITKKEIGKTVDTYGNFLPKDIEGSPYINQDYKNLSGDEKKFLDILTKYHFKAQEGLNSWYTKLDYDIPRYLKDTSEGKLKYEWNNIKEY